MTDPDEKLSGDLLQHFLAKRGKLEITKQKIEAVELIVLVCGPGEGSDGWEKRCQIQDELNAMPGVSAYFPEDPELDWVPNHFGLKEGDPTPLELAEADFVDLVVALETAPGVRDEVATFARRRSIAGKLIPLTPKRFRATETESYSGLHRRRLTKEYFSKDDYLSCCLATALCPKIVKGEQTERGIY